MAEMAAYDPNRTLLPNFTTGGIHFPVPRWRASARRKASFTLLLISREGQTGPGATYLREMPRSIRCVAE